jgi:hypothetical protein
VLRSTGIIRLIVPDLRHHVVEYIEGRTRADEFVEALGILHGNSNNVLKHNLSRFVQFPHKCMYDAPRLIELLSEIGFHASRRDAFDSAISDIRLIELEGRTENAVVVEGRKH